MSIAVAEIEARIRALRREDKADLVRSPVAELDGPADADVQRAWLVEAQRRYREVVEGKVESVPGEHILAKLRARLSG